MALRIKLVFFLVTFSYVILSCTARPNAIYALEERKVAASPGVVSILEGIVNLLQQFLRFLNGEGSPQEIAEAFQFLYHTLSQMVNVKAIVSEVPFVGRYFTPVIDGAAQVMENTPMLGGLLSQVLVGDD